MSVYTPARLPSLPTDHPVRPEATEVVVQQRYEIPPPATRHGFAPPFTPVLDVRFGLRLLGDDLHAVAADQVARHRIGELQVVFVPVVVLDQQLVVDCAAGRDGLGDPVVPAAGRQDDHLIVQEAGHRVVAVGEDLAQAVDDQFARTDLELDLAVLLRIVLVLVLAEGEPGRAGAGIDAHVHNGHVRAGRPEGKQAANLVSVQRVPIAVVEPQLVVVGLRAGGLVVDPLANPGVWLAGVLADLDFVVEVAGRLVRRVGLDLAAAEGLRVDHEPRCPTMATIYLRGKTWWISYSVGRKRIQRSLKTTNAREAEEYRKQYSAAETINLLPEPSSTPIGPFLHDLCEYWRKTRKGKGAASDIGRLRQFFGPVARPWSIRHEPRSGSRTTRPRRRSGAATTARASSPSRSWSN